MRDEYARAAEVLRVKDGDTFECRIDLGFMVHVEWACRIYGINAPEHDEPGGLEATAQLAGHLAAGPVTIKSIRLDKYAGRFVGQVFVYERGVQTDVAMALIKSGHAVAWSGRGAKPKVPWPPVHLPDERPKN